MKTMSFAELNNYQAPQVEVIEVEVEKGFAGSNGNEPTNPEEEF